MSIPEHLIERTWRMYEEMMTGSGIEASKLEYISGFGAAVGIMAGSFDVGIPPNTNPTQLLMQLVEELSKYRAELKAYEQQARDRTERHSKLRHH